MIKMIVAHDKNNLIGNKGKLPWHISEELKFFKEMTMGGSLLMGGKTFKGLPGKLPGRKHFIYERNNNPKADLSINNEQDLLKLFSEYKDSQETLWISGGKFIYENYFNNADEIYVSVIKGEYDGDVYLELNLSNYNKETFKETDKFTVYKYTKK